MTQGLIEFTAAVKMLYITFITGKSLYLHLCQCQKFFGISAISTRMTLMNEKLYIGATLMLAPSPRILLHRKR